MAIENENVADEQMLNQSSSEVQNAPSEMKKHWLKTLGKEYYQNETLGRYDSLKDAINDLLARPEKKEIPESYGYGDADEIFKKAGLSKAEADEIEAYYSKKIPARKDRKEIFGEQFDEMDRHYSKAVNTFGSDLAEEIKKGGYDRDPVVTTLLARVGKEIGSSNFNPTSRDGRPARVNLFEEILKGKR